MNEVVAVIGLGNIGSGVSQNLVRGGYEVWGSDLHAQPMLDLVGHGGFAAESAASAAAKANVIFTSLPGPRQILDVASEIVPAMKAGSIWVELSTSDLQTARQILGMCAEVGVRLIDAPVSGGPEGAAAGTLSIFVGGADNDVTAVMPILRVMSSDINHLGANGTGIVAKIAQVTLCYTQTVTLIEALILGVKGGIKPAKMLELIQNSAGSSYVANAYGPEIIAGTYDVSFPISHAAKDMRLAMDLAKNVEANLPFMAQVADLYDRAEAEYGPAGAHLLAAQIIERQNGVLLHQADPE